MRTTLFLPLLLACSTPTNTPESSVDPAEGSAPADLQPASTPAATLIVLNKSDATASLIDAADGTTLAVIPTGDGPHEVAVHGAVAVVCNYGQQVPGNTLTVIDVGRGEVVDTIVLGDHRRPHGIQFEDDGRYVVVTTEESRSLVRVDLELGKLAGVWPTDQDVSHMVVLAPDRKRAFVSNIGSGSITAIDMASGEILAQIATGRGAEGIDITPDGDEIWVGNRAEDTVTIVDARSLEVEATLACGGFPIRIKITPDGRHALVSNAESGDVAVFDVEGRRVLHRIPMDLSPTETEGRLFDSFEGSPVPVGILIRPDGKRAFVANTNADIVTEIDLETWQVVSRVSTGRQPDGLGWSTSAPGGDS